MYINEVNLNFNSLTYNNSPNKIILHHAEASNCSIADINSWHKEKGWSGCGYHYFIRKDGSVYRGRPENAQGAQCSGQNCESIGICFEGSYMKETMPQVQFNAGAELISDIRSRKGNLPIYGHGELFSTDCPGTNFPLGNFKGGTYTISQPISPPIAQSSGDSWISRLQAECNNQGFSNQVVDGINGSNTLAGCPTLRFGNSGNITRLLQEKLVSLGYNTNGIDGIYGNGTRTAIINFQNNNSLDADSIFGRMSWSKILSM